MVHRRRDEAGETLVELLVALTILGTAGVAVMAGIMLSVKSSTLQRNLASGGTYVRSYAEAIQAKVDETNRLPTCADALTTFDGLAVPGISGSDYAQDVVAVKSWNAALGRWDTCANGTGVYRPALELELKVTVKAAGDGARQATESMFVVLRTPCRLDVPNAGSNPCTV